MIALVIGTILIIVGSVYISKGKSMWAPVEYNNKGVKLLCTGVAIDFIFFIVACVSNIFRKD